MADENPSSRNLDLNLGPLDNSSYDSAPGSESYPYVSMNLEDWLDGHVPIPPETRNLALELSGGIEQHTGEGTVAPDERTIGSVKVSENGIGCLDDGGLGKKEGCGKNDGGDGIFFDCNICLDLAKDPVVTCCGHLFCWPCLYRWLHHHSDAKECPVCKGEVTDENLTPIYGQGNSIRATRVDSSLKIPLRPQARRLGSTFDLSRGFSHAPAPPHPRRRTNTERIDELYAWANYQQEYMAVSSAYQTSMYALLQGMTTHVGFDLSTYPPPPPFPPPFHFQHAFLEEHGAGQPPPEYEEDI